MFEKKYNVSIIDGKWLPIKRNVKLTCIPRIDEFIYFNEIYYRVVSVIHQLVEKQEIIIVVELLSEKPKIKLIDNQ
jgi:hypothetical protein